MNDIIFPISDKEAKKTGIKNNSKIRREALFPTRLRELRENKSIVDCKKITQQILADEIGVTKSTISLYEMGDNVPDARTIVKLAKYYNVGTDYLLCETDIDFSTKDLKEIYAKTGLSEEVIHQIMKWKMIYGKNGYSRRRLSVKESLYNSELILNAFLENPDLYELFFRFEDLLSVYKALQNSKCFEGEKKDTAIDEDLFQYNIWVIQKDINKIIVSTVKRLYEIKENDGEKNA